MFYLVCYDVVSNLRRNRVAKLLSGYGLRVQKSVFECVLNEREYEMLTQKLQQQINLREDQVRFYPLNAACRQDVTILGIRPQVVVDDAVFIV